jgi:hypothetical protein
MAFANPDWEWGVWSYEGTKIVFKSTRTAPIGGCTVRGCRLQNCYITNSTLVDCELGPFFADEHPEKSVADAEKCVWDDCSAWRRHFENGQIGNARLVKCDVVSEAPGTAMAAFAEWRIPHAP